MTATAPLRALAAALALAATGALAIAAPPAGAGERVPPEVVVGLEQGAGPAVRAAVERRAGVRLGAVVTGRGARVARVTGATTVEGALARLAAHPAVRWAEPNRVHRRQIVPSDRWFGLQWGLLNRGDPVFGGASVAGADIGAPAAWDLTTGSDRVRVAVVDGGVDHANPDLAPNIGVVNPGEAGAGREADGVDDDRNGLVDDWRGWDFVDGDNDPRDGDPARHGTAVAGVVAARGGDGGGVAGVSWTSRVIPVRALDERGSGTDADLAAAITYAAAQGARILTASFGGGESRAIREAIAAAPQVLVVAAAGNDGLSNEPPAPDRIFPCSLPLENVVCVAATGPTDRLAGFSNFGVTTVDIAAPGVDVVGPPATPDGAPRPLSGTSFAAPHAAGVAALVLAAAPEASTRQLRRALLEGATPLGALAGRVATGARLSAPGALAAIPPAGPGPGGATGPAVDLGPTAARLTGSVPASLEPLSHHFEYGPTEAYGSATPPRPLAPGAARDVSADVTGLTAGAPLHHRLVVTAIGGITRGADVASRIPPPPPPATAGAEGPVRRAARATARIVRVRGRPFVVVALSERSRVSVLVQRRRPPARGTARFTTVRGLRARTLAPGPRRLALGPLRPGRHRVTVRVRGPGGALTLIRPLVIRAAS